MKKIIILLIIIVLQGKSLLSQRILINESFENGPYSSDSIPAGWTKFKVNGPGTCTVPPIPDWRVRDSGKIFCASFPQPGFTSKAYYSNKSLCIPWTATKDSTTTDDWIFTGSLYLFYGDSLKFRVQLGTWPDGQSSYYLDSLQVWITTVNSPAGGTRTKLATITSLPAASNVWQYKMYNLNAFSYQQVYIGFRYYMDISVNGNMVNLDNVFVGNLSSPVGVQQLTTDIPEAYDLKQNYPNPFNPVTLIEFDLPKNDFVRLAVYDLLGQEVAVPVNNFLNAGSHSVSFDAGNLPGGIYIYKMNSGSFTQTRKMSFVK